MALLDDFQKRHEQYLVAAAKLKSKLWDDYKFLEDVRCFSCELDSFLKKHKSSLEPGKKVLLLSWKEHWKSVFLKKPK